MSRLRLGISACLLNLRVRYDGRLKQHPVVVDQLSKMVALLPVCPEMECGMQVPREAIQLEDKLLEPRLRTVNSKQDITDRLASWSTQRLDLLKLAELDGYLFKSKSPSCGLVDTPVFAADGEILGYGGGLYARALQNAFPKLPLCDEKALNDPRRWQQFVEQIMHKWIARGAAGENKTFAGEGAEEDDIDKLRQKLLELSTSAQV